MNRILEAANLFPIPDDTLVSPILNTLDANQTDLPSGLPPALSSAARQIHPGVRCKICIHPFVSVVPWMVEGLREVRSGLARVVTPAYVFDLEGHGVVYDHAFLVDHSGEELAAQNWNVTALEHLADLANRRDFSRTHIEERLQAPNSRRTAR